MRFSAARDRDRLDCRGLSCLRLQSLRCSKIKRTTRGIRTKLQFLNVTDSQCIRNQTDKITLSKRFDINLTSEKRMTRTISNGFVAFYLQGQSESDKIARLICLPEAQAW